MERRTLLRLLVGLAIGIPVLVEALTFLGLVETRLFGDGEDGGEGTPTAGVDRVGVGDELLPDTAPSETVRQAVIHGEDEPWVFVMTVEVENGTEAPYELRLATLTLGSGATVDSRSSTGRVPAGGSGRVTGAWEIPQGSTPRALDVVSVTDGADGPTEETTRVALAKVPVRGH